MRTAAAVAEFKTQQGLADVLNRCTQAAISQWDEYPPLLRQLEIESLTGGKLKAEPDCDKYRVPAKAAA